MLTNVKCKQLLVTGLVSGMIGAIDFQIPEKPPGADWRFFETAVYAQGNRGIGNNNNFSQRSSSQQRRNSMANNRSRDSLAANSGRTQTTNTRSRDRQTNKPRQNTPTETRSHPNRDENKGKNAPVRTRSSGGQNQPSHNRGNLGNQLPNPIPLPEVPNTKLPANPGLPKQTLPKANIKPVEIPNPPPAPKQPVPALRDIEKTRRNRDPVPPPDPNKLPITNEVMREGQTADSFSNGESKATGAADRPPTLHRILQIVAISLFGLPIGVAIAKLSSALVPASIRNGTALASTTHNIVTVSKLRVAFLSEAIEVDEELSQASLDIDRSSERSLWETLQNVLAIIRQNSEFWSHVVASSETVKLDRAETAFDNFGAQKQRQLAGEGFEAREPVQTRTMFHPTETEPEGSYSMVTLLLETADRQPLFGSIHSAQDLEIALEVLSSLRSRDLLAFELLWTPPEFDGAFSDEEMLTD